MIPSIVAQEVTRALHDFLATGFGPSNPALATVLDDFLAEPENLLEVLQASFAALQNCECGRSATKDPQQDGCYRRFYAYRRNRDIENTSRGTAAGRSRLGGAHVKIGNCENGAGVGRHRAAAIRCRTCGGRPRTSDPFATRSWPELAVLPDRADERQAGDKRNRLALRTLPSDNVQPCEVRS